MLATQTRQRGIDRLHVALFAGATRQCEHGLPRLEPLIPHQPARGWVAISEAYAVGSHESTALRNPCDPVSFWSGAKAPPPPQYFRWLDGHEPAWRGGDIRLYHITAPLG
jgi:hypothetical protein